MIGPQNSVYLGAMQGMGQPPAPAPVSLIFTIITRNLERPQ